MGSKHLLAGFQVTTVHELGALFLQPGPGLLALGSLVCCLPELAGFDFRLPGC